MDAGSFLWSFLLVGRARWEGVARLPKRRGGSIARIVAAVRMPGGDRLLLTVLTVEVAHALAMGLFLAALPAFIRDLGSDSALYGLQGGVFWTGAVVASGGLGYRPYRRVGVLYAAGVTLNAIGNTWVGFAHGAAGLLGAVFVAGLGWPSWQTGLRSLLQAHVPPGGRGATFAGLEAATASAMIPAWLVGGWAADHMGARTVIAAAPLVHLGLGISLWLVPAVRRFALHEVAPDHHAFGVPRRPG